MTSKHFGTFVSCPSSTAVVLYFLCFGNIDAFGVLQVNRPGFLGGTHRTWRTTSLLLSQVVDTTKQERPRYADEEHVSKDPSQMAIAYVHEHIDPTVLIQIACSFAPSPHDNLHPHQVSNANVVHVDASHMDLAVAVADETGFSCVQVLVSVPFPQPLSGIPNWQATLWQNLQQLHEQAQGQIARQEWEHDNAHVLAEQQQILNYQQQDVSKTDRPDWWTPPYGDLFDECASLKSLLNEEDFSPDLEKLWLSRYEKHSPGVSVIKACVASLGPAGLILRARFEVNYGDGDSSPDDALVEIRFANVADSPDELRSFVLDLVESQSEVSSPPASAEPQPLKSAVEEVTSADTYGATNDIGAVGSLTEASLPPTRTDYTHARRQPKSAAEEAALAQKYGAIADVGDRAYAILKDLSMI